MASESPKTVPCDCPLTSDEITRISAVVKAADKNEDMLTTARRANVTVSVLEKVLTHIERHLPAAGSSPAPSALPAMPPSGEFQIER